MLANNKIKLSVILLASLCVIALANCISSAKRSDDPRGPMYAGSEACRTCHQGIYESFIHTAHANTTSDSLHADALAAFEEGSNVFVFNDSVSVVMAAGKHPVPFRTR